MTKLRNGFAALWDEGGAGAPGFKAAVFVERQIGKVFVDDVEARARAFQRLQKIAGACVKRNGGAGAHISLNVAGGCGDNLVEKIRHSDDIRAKQLNR